MQQGEPRYIAQIATVNGIDFKNPFTMSKRSSKLRPRANPRISVSSFLENSGKDGGASRDRTDDLKLAKLALSQLSYGPVGKTNPAERLSNGGPSRS